MTAIARGLVGLAVLLGGASAAHAEGLAEAMPAAGNAWHIAVADVTGDGRPEIVYACYNGRVCCQDRASSDVLWQFDTGAFPYDLAAADLDGDGKAETMVASADGNLYVLAPDGALWWKHTTHAPLYQVAAVTTPETVLVLTGGVDRNLYVLTADGTLRKSLPQDEVVRLLAGGDLDGDGWDEILVGSHVGRITALEPAELKVLWQSRLRPVVDGRQLKAPWRPYSMRTGDLDGDGRAEVLLGSGFYNQCGIRVLTNRGERLWDKPEGFYFRDGTQYSHTDLVACDVTDAPGKEMVALSARRLFVFDREGNELARAESSLAFTDICVADGGGHTRPELWLASTPNGDDRIYRVRLADGWEAQFAGLEREGKMRRVTENLNAVRRQIMAYQGTAPPGRHYVHIVTGGQPDTPQKVRAHFGLIDWYRRQFPYPSCTFAMSINVAADEPVPGFFRPDARTEGHRLPAGEIVALLRTCEEAHVDFLVTVGHGCEPQIRLETADAILKACPGYCLGFSCSENSDHGDRLDHYFRDYWFPLMDLCKRHGKKAVLIEKGAWWATIPAMARFRRLVDGTYADTLVMSVEDSNSRCPELNLAGRAGLFATGCVNTFSARTIADELCWNRYWEWEFPMTGHPFLRRQMAQAALGATFFEYHLFMQTLGNDRRFTTIGSESIELLIHMLGKGLLVPPPPDAMLGIAPVAIRIREPDERFLAEAFNFHLHREFAWDADEAASPLEGVACHWGAAPTRPNYFGRYLFNQDRHYGAFVPATPFGFPLVVPAFVDPGRFPRLTTGCQTDGRVVYDSSGPLSGVEARPRVLESFQQAARQLPFRADGNVFLQSQRIGERNTRITLIDPGFLDPADRQVVLHAQTATPPRELVDLLSGRRLTMHNRAAELTVPAGAFRILEARY